MKNNLLAVWIVLFAFVGGIHAQNRDSLTLVNAKWDTKQLAEGVEWRQYHFRDNEKLFGANEYINIIVVDQQKAKVRFALANKKNEKMRPSDAAKSIGAMAAINGSFYNTQPPYNPESYLKIDGELLSAPMNYGDCIIIDKNGHLKVEWTNASALVEPDVLGSWPKLVSAGKQIFKEEDRHPRTAIGTNGEKVFLVTVDGRNRKNSEGVTINELGSLLRWMGANEALNLDGGGSTTMYIRGESNDGIVNHPSDGLFGFNHRGERSVCNSILLLDSSMATMQ